VSDDSKSNLCNIKTTGPDEDGQIISMTYIPESILIGSGETTLPTVNSEGNGIWQLSLPCVRKGSAEVATKFIDFVGGNTSQMLGKTSQSGTSPAYLNFCFGYTVEFRDGTSLDIYFAQGHYSVGSSSVNNWWMACDALSHDWEKHEGSATLKLNTLELNASLALSENFTLSSD